MQGSEPAKIDRDRVFAALKNILASDEFVASPQLAAFLTYSVQQSLDGHGPTLKAYTIATEVLGRPASFDPQNDPIVRVEATRLRRAIDRHYATTGAQERVRISMPKGGYAVTFDFVADEEPSRAPAPQRKRAAAKPSNVAHYTMIAGIILLSLAAVAGAGWLLKEKAAQPLASSPQILAIQTAAAEPSADDRPNGRLPSTKPVSTWKPRVAAIALKHDEVAKPLFDDIVNIMVRFDGVSIYGESTLPDPVPDDLYILEGQRHASSETSIDLRLIHAGSSRIVLARTVNLQGDADAMALIERKLALDIAGRDGIIRTDALPPTLSAESDHLDAHGCLAVVHAGIKMQEPALLKQARHCLDALIKMAANSAMLLATSADLRRHEANGNLDQAADEAQRALALDPKNITAMQVLSDLLETKNPALSLRMGDMALEANPLDPAFLRIQAKRLQDAGLIGRAETLLRDADSVE